MKPAVFAAPPVLFALALLPAVAGADEKAPALAVSCAYQASASDPEITVVFHLSSYDADGTSRYRALTAPLNEIEVAPDGSIKTQPNPCKGPLTMLR